MLRRLIAAGFVLLFSVGLILAVEMKGKVKDIDTAKGVLTVTTQDDDKKDVDVMVKIGKKTKLMDDKGDVKIEDVKKGATFVGTYEEVEKNGKKRKVFSEVKVTNPPTEEKKDK